MIARIFLAATAVVAIPLAVAGHAQAPTQARNDTAKRICEVDQPTGSRLGGVRRCMTRAEREQARADSKLNTERIQSQKNFTEAMYGAGTQGICRACPRVC